MLPSKLSVIGKFPGKIPQSSAFNTRVPRFGPFGSYANVLYRPQGFAPTRFAGLASWYDVSDLSSLRYDGSNRIQLIGDKSGNSSVNGLVLNGASGNYASAPDSAALDIAGDIDLRAWVALNDWTPGSTNSVVGKVTTTGNQRSYLFSVLAAGTLQLLWSEDGAVSKTSVSTASVSFTDYSAGWIRATLDVDNGAAGNTATFYTSTNGTTWTQLGDPVVTASVTSIFVGTSPVGVGAFNSGTQGLTTGSIFRAQIYNGINGTLAFDANFTAQAKLAASFTESSANAATVTVNATGDLGARISGARDQYQAGTTKKFILTVSGSRSYATSDGINDYTRALWSMAQPITRFTVARQVSWASGGALWDGANGANTAALVQTTTTPQINLNAGSSVAANTDMTVGETFVITEVINGASSSLQIDNLTATTGNAGAGTPNGTTIAADGAATAANFTNQLFMERVTYNVVLTDAQKAVVKQYLSAKWGAPL